MSAQNGLIPQGTGNQIVTPLAKKQVQVFRDNAVSGDGTYYGRLPDGTNEKIGGPGSGSGMPFGNDTNVDPNIIQVTLPGFVSLVDDYTFEVRNLTTNTGATQLQIGASGLKDVVDTDGNPLTSGMLVNGSIYLFAYDLSKDKYELLGLARDNGVNGTLNFIAKFTPDGKHVGDSLIFDNGTNVGIGTITPTSLLELKADENYILTINRDNAVNETSAIKFQRQGNNTWAIGPGAQNLSGHEFSIFDFNLSYSPLYIDNLGHVGLGLNGGTSAYWATIKGNNFQLLNLTTSTAAETALISFSSNGAPTNINWYIGSDINVGGAGVHTFGILDNKTGKTSFLVDSNDNILIGNISTTGTNAQYVFTIGTGTEPTTSPADRIQIYSVSSSDASATLGFRTPQAVVNEIVVSDATLKVRINGTEYKICLKQ